MVLPIQVLGRQTIAAPSVQAVVGGLIIAAIAGPFGWSWVCLAALLVSTVSEPSLHHRQPLAINLLRQASLGLTVRVTLRLLCALALVAHGGLTRWEITVLGLSALLFVAGRAGYVLASGRLTRLRRSVIESRNLPLDGLDVPPAPPQWLTAWSGSVVSASELLITVPACVAAASVSVVGFFAPLAVVSVLAAAAWCWWASALSSSRLAPENVVAAVQQQLDAFDPEVLLYFGDGASAVYQVNMWLEAMERLPQRCVILLRSRAALAALGATRIPVLCVPAAETLMALDLTAIRVALYVSNVGNNIHMLRVPGIRSAFIGHGDSDKTASFNPYSRVYDEVWVAGPAGRRRYREADIGVPDSRVVEVGRPQLDGASANVAVEGHIPTVLYAPTWEGWDEAQSYSSVAAQGLALATSILREDSGVRLIYRPHPFLGRRDPSIAAAHRRIVEMIDQANRRSGRSGAPVMPLQIEDPLNGITDPMQRSVVSGRAQRPPSALEVAELRAGAELAYWSDLGPEAHVVISSDGPSLLSCFVQADVLVTDVSSVLSDFLPTGRPYAVCNVTAPSEEEFLDAVPSARAGVVLGRTDDPDVVLQLARGDVADTHAGLRERLRGDLLGEDTIPAQERFRRAVSALVGQASRDGRVAAFDGQPSPQVEAGTLVRR
jgi:hypothetical protein